MGQLREQFLREGFLYLPNLLEDVELKNLIDISIPEHNDSKDLTSYSELWKLILNSKVLKVLKEIFENDLHYNFDSNFLRNAKTEIQPRLLLHRDNQTDYNPEESYEIARCAVYLNDYSNLSDCLSLVPVSHKSVDLNFKNILRLFRVGNKFVEKRQKSLYNYNFNFNLLPLKIFNFFRKPRINIVTKPGDFVLWNLRTLHQGYSKRFKFLKNYCIPNLFYYFLPKFLFLPSPNSRDAIFFVFYSMKNDESGQIKAYCDHRCKEIGEVHWSFKPSPLAINEFKNHGIKLDTRGYDLVK
jgi:hypothetical protein